MTRGRVGDGITNVTHPHLTGTAQAGSTVRLYARRRAHRHGHGVGRHVHDRRRSAGLGGVFDHRDGDRRRRQHQRGEPGALADDRHDAARRAHRRAARGRRHGRCRRRDHEHRPAAAYGRGAGGIDGQPLDRRRRRRRRARRRAARTRSALNSPLADGTYSVTATATDAAGNTSAASAAFALTIDTTAPAAPPAPSLLAADDSGTVGDGITNVNRPRLTGSAQAGSVVQLYRRGSVVGTGTATGGTYTIALASALAGGAYAITATATDLAGNTSAASAPFSLTILTTPPAAPTLAMLPADNTGRPGRRRYRKPSPPRHGRRGAGQPRPAPERERHGHRHRHGGEPRRRIHDQHADGAGRHVHVPHPRRGRRGECRARRARRWRSASSRRRATTSATARPTRSRTTRATRSGRSSRLRRAPPQVSFGLPNSVPVSADYDGDGKTDLAVYQPSSGEWMILNSSTGKTTTYMLGQPGDFPVPDDYTGIGRAEPAVYRPSTAQWIVFNPVNKRDGYIWTSASPTSPFPSPQPTPAMARPTWPCTCPRPALGTASTPRTGS